MAKTLRNTARLLGKEIELETYFNRSNTITTTTTSGLVKGTVGWGFYSYDENNPEESFYAFDHYILGRAKTYAKGRRKMEDLKTAFAKLPLSAFTLTEVQPSLQLKQYLELSDRVANQLGGGKFLRPASIKALENMKPQNTNFSGFTKTQRQKVQQPIDWAKSVALAANSIKQRDGF